MRLELEILLFFAAFVNAISAVLFTPTVSEFVARNESENRILQRQKRFFPLVFPGGGVAKFVSELIYYDNLD